MEQAMNAIEGGCACGAVRYRSNSAPVFSLHCHCRQCQRISGTGHASLFGLPAASVVMTGDLKLHQLIADSGNRVSAGFCPQCGNPVMKRSSGQPDLLFLHAATLDDPAQFKADRVVWSASRPPWDHIDPDLPCD